MLNSAKYFHHVLNSIPKRPVVFTSDMLLTAAAMCYACWIDSANSFHPIIIPMHTAIMLCVISIQAASCYLFGLYRGLWRYASLHDLVRITKACVHTTCLAFILSMYINIETVLRPSTLGLFCVLAIFLLSGSRITYRWIKETKLLSRTGTRVLVIGAGDAGESILRELKRKSSKDFRPIGILDDNPAKVGLDIQGVRVLGVTHELPNIVAAKAVELILLALPTANSAQMRSVVELCESCHVPYRTLPSLKDITTGKDNITNIRQVSVEDLLCREPISFNREALSREIGHRVVLVTGAGGSIGAELCRNIAECQPSSLILIEHSEFNLFNIHNELKRNYPQLDIHCYLVSITHRDLIHHIMKMHQPEYLFHAAAYKHVPLLEPQIRVAIDNNIFGTQILAEVAVANHVKKFILVSTDKAVNPSNVMGATKRCAEMICQSLNHSSDTRFVIVRFGNVLGSAGSVVPLFKEQIAHGGPVTITHPEMERYFMTIQEAAQLIIQTATFAQPSDLYVLDMGEPIKIQYLAEQMIKLAGHKPNIDIPIIYTGLRPGEKINEELFYQHEITTQSAHDKIISVAVPSIDSQKYLWQLQQLHQVIAKPDEQLRTYLFDMAYTRAIDHMQEVI